MFTKTNLTNAAIAGFQMTPGIAAFDEIRRKMGISHRVFFQNKKELSLLLQAYQYTIEDLFDTWSIPNMQSWKNNQNSIVSISPEIFDEEGRLKIFTPVEWNQEWVLFRKLEIAPPPPEDVPL